jgi:hypothetical protein
MTLYKIKIANRNYESWQVYNSSTMEPILIDDLNPIIKIAKKKEITLNNDNDSSLIDRLTNNENEEKIVTESEELE